MNEQLVAATIVAGAKELLELALRPNASLDDYQQALLAQARAVSDKLAQEKFAKDPRAE